jgi:hypothetical protein
MVVAVAAMLVALGGLGVAIKAVLDDGQPGPPGPRGPVEIDSLNTLEGTPCEANGKSGKTVLTFSADGTAEIGCNTTTTSAVLEPNETPEDATVLAYGETVNAEIATVDDVDYWHVFPAGSCTTRDPCDLVIKIRRPPSKLTPTLWPVMCVWQGDRATDERCETSRRTADGWTIPGLNARDGATFGIATKAIPGFPAEPFRYEISSAP